MKKFVLCFVMLMSVGQVFAPIFITNNDRATEEVNRLIRLRLSMRSGAQIPLPSRPYTRCHYNF